MGAGGWSGENSSTFHLLCTSFLFLLHCDVSRDNYTTHHNAKSAITLGLFSGNQTVPSGGDGGGAWEAAVNIDEAFTYFPTAHLLLWGSVPERPQGSTCPWPRGSGPLS